MICNEFRRRCFSLLAVSIYLNYMSGSHINQFPSVISTPFPTNRLASAALQALQVDAELSPLVRRSFSLTALLQPQEPATTESSKADPVNGASAGHLEDGSTEENKTILQAKYSATTNRMLRVSVNGYLESLGLLIGIMEELDVDVLAEKRNKLNS